MFDQILRVIFSGKSLATDCMSGSVDKKWEYNGRDDRMDEAGYVGQCRRPGHRLLYYPVGR